MPDEKKPPVKVIMTDGSLEDLDALLLDASPEEVEGLQTFLDRFKKAAEDGTLMENCEPVDMEKLREEEPELAVLLEERHDAVLHQIDLEENLDLAIEFHDKGSKEKTFDKSSCERFALIRDWLLELKRLRKYEEAVEEWIKEQEGAVYLGEGREGEWTKHLLRTLRKKIEWGAEKKDGGHVG